MEEQEQMDVASIVRSIFCSCDVDNTDLVPVSKLIEFVQPFMTEDLSALADLKESLDPEGKNVLVNSEQFYEVMKHWSQKMAASSSNEENQFNRTPSRLTVIDDKELPYTHSTPRASLGEKLLRCKDLLNLSNVSGYSLSTSRLDTNPADSDKTVLEEEIKKLEHQLSKTTNELAITKQHLTASEEQNETLQQDFERLNRRLHAEQQVNEHLQKEKNISDDLREELNQCKKVVEELKRKLSQSEKDGMYHIDLINEFEQEKLKLEKKIEVLSKQYQDCLKDIFDIKTELETKEQQLIDVKKVYDELKSKFAEQKDFIDQLREENDILCHQKSTLKKAIKAKSSASLHSNLGNLDFSSTPSPQHNTHNTSSNSPIGSPNLSHQNDLQPKCQSLPLLRRVLARKSSTPVNQTNSLLDTSLPDSIKNCPMLSPIHGARQNDDEKHQGSSEEDLYWKLQQGGDARVDHHNGTSESLETEMCRADPARNSETYHTALFEKDEQIIELEDELEKVKNYLKAVEDQNNEFLTKLKEQKKLNDELVDANFIFVNKEESARTKVESLKNRIAQLEKNGVILENEEENSQGELEKLKNKIGTLEEMIEMKNDTMKELTSRIERVVSLEKEVIELKEHLIKADNLVAEYEERLQATMRDLGKVSLEKICIEEKLKSLDQEKLESNQVTLEETLKQTKDLEEKLVKIRQQNEDICRENNVLKQEISTLKEDLVNAVSKYEHIAKKNSAMEEELRDLRDLNNNKDQEIARHKEQLRLKDTEVKDFMNAQKQKEEELELFKQNLEKKIVTEFENKVRYSVEAEEKILNLTKKCTELEDALTDTLSKLNTKNRILSETETNIKSLKQLETSLKEEISTLKASKTELESTVINLKAEQDEFLAKLPKIERIDMVTTDIQKHIKDKNIIIEELKELNKKMEFTLNKTQLDLKGKIDDVLKLRNEWLKGIEVKNDLWKTIKTIEQEYHYIKENNKELLEKQQELLLSNEQIKIEYNNLLIIYDLEVNKNTKLNKKIAEFIEEKDLYFNKYNELKKELDNLNSDFDTEKRKNQEFTQYMSEYQVKMNDSQNKLLQDQLSQVQKNDNMSQTEVDQTETLEEEFSKIKVESDKILEELESKLNEEVDKNRTLTKSLKEMKIHLDQSNNELLEMKQKITDSETDMMTKFQQNMDSNRKLAEELSQTKETISIKNVELIKFGKHLKDTEEKLELLNKNNILLNQKLANKCEELEKMERKVKEVERELQLEIEMKNAELLKKLTDIESLLEQRQIELERIENHNNQLLSELQITKKEKETLDSELISAMSEVSWLKEKLHEQEKNEQEKRRSEILQIEDKNRNLLSQLELTKDEKEKTNKKLGDITSEITHLRENISTLENEKSILLVQKQLEIRQLQDELDVTKPEIKKLNNELQNATSEIIRLKESLAEHQKRENTLLQETKQKLQEEITKNRAIFKNFSLLKKEREQLIFDLNDMKSSLSDSTTLYNKKQTELKEFQVKCSELEQKIQIQEEQLKKSEILIQQSQDELNKNNFEKCLMNTELSKVKSFLDKANSDLKNMEILLLETKKELNVKCLNNDRLILELEEAKRKLSENFNSDGSTCSERDTSKRKTYSRQQITIDKLKDKLEEIEKQLKMEKSKNIELKTQMSLSESKIIGDEDGCKREIEKLQEQLIDKEKCLEKIEKQYLDKKKELIVIEERVKVAKEELETTNSEVENRKLGLKSSRSLPSLGKKENGDECRIKSEGKTVNKFTLNSRPVSPDSPSLNVEPNGCGNQNILSFYPKCPYGFNRDSVLEIPAIDITSFADDIIEQLELLEGSPRKKLNREETEKHVTALTLRLLVHSNAISEKIEQKTEKYRCQYEEIMTLIRDISNRLRDHVCIGTAEPIMPVFVLLEEIRLTLKNMVQTTGQVGVLVYEDRMKKCWNLVTNYMAMLRQENESLRSISRETTPTQTGIIRRRNKSTQDKGDLPEQTSTRRNFIQCTRMTVTLLFVLAFTLTISIIVQFNCRMTSSETQYCPLDGIVTRINVGQPPM